VGSEREHRYVTEVSRLLISNRALPNNYGLVSAAFIGYLQVRFVFIVMTPDGEITDPGIPSGGAEASLAGCIAPKDGRFLAVWQSRNACLADRGPSVPL